MLLSHWVAASIREVKSLMRMAGIENLIHKLVFTGFITMYLFCDAAGETIIKLRSLPLKVGNIFADLGFANTNRVTLSLLGPYRPSLQALLTTPSTGSSTD